MSSYNLNHRSIQRVIHESHLKTRVFVQLGKHDRPVGRMGKKSWREDGFSVTPRKRLRKCWTANSRVLKVSERAWRVTWVLAPYWRYPPYYSSCFYMRPLLVSWRRTQKGMCFQTGFQMVLFPEYRLYSSNSLMMALLLVCTVTPSRMKIVKSRIWDMIDDSYYITSPKFRSVRFWRARYSQKCFTQSYRVLNGDFMLVRLGKVTETSVIER